MEGSGTGIGRMDCYEDMFKEITRKLYGDDTDQRSTSVQNEFETVTFKTEDESENGTDANDDGNWIIEEEPLKGTDGSRVAAYHVGKSTWKCYECGEIITGLPREVAEHFMEIHFPDSRNRHHSSRKDYMQVELKQEDVTAYLERVRERAERIAPPLRRTQETQTVPATLLPVSPTFLLQEIPSVAQQQQIHQQSSSNIVTVNSTPTSSKRYSCPVCSYSTDRRDLFTRHENIHRLEKPFECYACHKPFNRADHVKKHFLRMHRELQYDISRIRRPEGSTSSAQRNLQQSTPSTNGTATQQNVYPAGFNNNSRIQIQPSSSGSSTIYQSPTVSNTNIIQPDVSRRVQNGGCNSKSHVKSGQKSQSERKYSCDFCSWTGVDNWCLKRHLNTHLKPYACSLCEYKAARSERLTTHVLKVHNRRQCSRCAFLAEDLTQLQAHQVHVHRLSGANTSAAVVSTPVTTTPPQPQNNRLQQPLHPMGGRPPPGPPVFPAPAPAIAQSPAVLPASTMLGHEMVNIPTATATPASSPREEAFCPDDRGTNSLIGGLETTQNDEKYHVNVNFFPRSDFMAFLEAMRRVFKSDDRFSGLLLNAQKTAESFHFHQQLLNYEHERSTPSIGSHREKWQSTSPISEYQENQQRVQFTSEYHEMSQSASFTDEQPLFLKRSLSEEFMSADTESEASPIDFDRLDDNQEQKMQEMQEERCKVRKQKKPRKACQSVSEDEWLKNLQPYFEDMTAVRTTASVVVQPVENGIVRSCEQPDKSEGIKEEFSERQ